MNSPFAVFDNAKKYKSKIVLIQLVHNGNNFVVIMRVRTNYKSRKIDVEINSIRSLYPNDNKEGIIDWINSMDDLLLSVNKEKALYFISTQWPNYIAGGNEAQSNYEIKLNKLYESAKVTINNYQNQIFEQGVYSGDVDPHSGMIVTPPYSEGQPCFD